MQLSPRWYILDQGDASRHAYSSLYGIQTQPQETASLQSPRLTRAVTGIAI